MLRSSSQCPVLRKSGARAGREVQTNPQVLLRTENRVLRTVFKPTAFLLPSSAGPYTVSYAAIAQGRAC